MKRYFLFFLTNILVMISLNFVYMALVAAGIIPPGYQSQIIAMSIIFGFGGSFVSLLLSKTMAKMAMGVQIVDSRGPYSQLVNRVHTLAKQAGLTKMPEVGIYESPEVNAFATGPSKNNSLVAVSTGLLNRMDSQAVDGVLAHEVAHVANGDMVTMTLVQGIVNTFTYLVTFVVTNLIASALRGDSERGVGDSWFVRNMIFNLVYMLVAFAAYPLVATFSRYREYRADAGGAKLAGQGSMIHALESLQNNIGNVGQADASMAAMKISSRGSWAEWFSTHPPLEKRIRALQARA